MVQTINKIRFAELLKIFQFGQLFNELGWDHIEKKLTLTIDDDIFSLEAIAEKRGFIIFVCSPNNLGNIPDSNNRRKIDSRLTKLFFEHLIIYSDIRTQQVWQLVIREHNKPITVREVTYYTHQAPELLYLKLSSLFVPLEEEEGIRLVDIRSNVYEQFNVNTERVTRRFYTEFKTHYTEFLSFIKGITEKVDLEWYASLMLNRLMFIYFIQKKGFLDNDRDYLCNKLNFTRSKKGKDKFYSFYKDFLLVLFHKGLGSPDRSKKLENELGRIPYLNGGLFEVHKLERTYDIDIPDKAFEIIFEYFDQYNWILDTRIMATGRDINPDVIGYIFEKYVNDRAAMGAYYTKEDITEYISKNTIIPFLFDQVKKECANAFRDDSSLWKMLRENPDRYIYDAVKHGIYEENDTAFSSPLERGKRGVLRELPPEIQKGINPEIQKRIVKDVDKSPPQLLELRKDWNKPAPPEFALPTEIWREVVERRNRYFDIKKKIETGEIKEINDFITYNLDIRQFAQDAVEQYEGSDFINAFFKAISKISILDPTSGSAAFLFAALNILEPLFEACLKRMREFVEEDDLKGGKRYPQFRKVLQEIEHHPNEKYFIYKSIILNNLYGVDIMNEAVEIAKLRLFLKLVAEIDVDYNKPNLGLEPLPDIDFNIRCGNTLVGFARLEDVKKALEVELNFNENLIDKIDEEAGLVNKAFKYFKDSQINLESSVLISAKNAARDDKSYTEFIKAKKELEKRLKKLNDELNIYLAKLYGKTPAKKKEYEHWLATHQPFHWFAEFYEIMNSGGFDVIIGNPPYVEYSKVRDTYAINNYVTEKCANLYGFVIERSFSIMNEIGLTSMIIPISSISNNSMESLQKFFRNYPLLYFSTYHQRPAQLFEGVLQRLTIFISRKVYSDKNIFSTKVYRWQAETRGQLFQLIYYTRDDQNKQLNMLKIGHPIECSIYKKYSIHKSIKDYLSRYKNQNKVSYRTAGGGYWVTFLNSNFKTKSLSNKIAFFQDQYHSKTFMAVLNSNLFWWYYSINYDQFNFKDYMIFGFQMSYPKKDLVTHLSGLSDHLENELLSNASTYTIRSKTKGPNTTITYNKNLSKVKMDEIDKVLAEHYGFIEEELDFIINYDIKYRMGKELEED